MTIIVASAIFQVAVALGAVIGLGVAILPRKRVIPRSTTTEKGAVNCEAPTPTLFVRPDQELGYGR